VLINAIANGRLNEYNGGLVSKLLYSQTRKNKTDEQHQQNPFPVVPTVVLILQELSEWLSKQQDTSMAAISTIRRFVVGELIVSR
jgi:hypothetical protein